MSKAAYDADAVARMIVDQNERVWKNLSGGINGDRLKELIEHYLAEAFEGGRQSVIRQMTDGPITFEPTPPNHALGELAAKYLQWCLARECPPMPTHVGQYAVARTLTESEQKVKDAALAYLGRLFQ